METHDMVLLISLGLSLAAILISFLTIAIMR